MPCTINPNANCQNENLNLFTQLYNAGTVASRAKKVPKKESVICVEINRPVLQENIKSTTSDSLTHTYKSTLTDANNVSKLLPKSSRSSSIPDNYTKVTKELSKPKSCEFNFTFSSHPLKNYFVF